MKNLLLLSCACAFAIDSSRGALTNEPTAPLSAESSADTRHGLFNWLDSRSQYGQGVFPEPFLVDDSDLEPSEARLDWIHTQAGGAKTDILHPEVEKGFGMVTFELEVPYEFDRTRGITTRGFDNIDFGARAPFYQFVSPNSLVDSTFGAAIEAGIPTESPLGKNAELVPKLFDDTKMGNFTAQSILGYSTLFGPGEEGGLQAFEYGFVFGCTIAHRQLPLVDVLESIPFLELKGETELNKNDPGHTTLLGNVGFRFNLKAIGGVQPRPGIGFIFPLNNGGRDDTHWGVITSLVFQF